MHEQEFHSVMRLAGRFVFATESIAKSLSQLAASPHPEPGALPLFARRILDRIDQLEQHMSNQNQALLIAVQGVAAAIGPLTDKITEVNGEVQQVLDLLNGNNPDVAQAISQLQGIKTSLENAQTALQGVDDKLDQQLGTGGGGGGGGGALAVSGISPDSGQTGTSVSVSGSGFDASCTVSFGGAAGVAFDTFSDDGSNGTVTVPSDAISGAVTVTKGSESATGPSFTIV